MQMIRKTNSGAMIMVHNGVTYRVKSHEAYGVHVQCNGKNIALWSNTDVAEWCNANNINEDTKDFYCILTLAIINS